MFGVISVVFVDCDQQFWFWILHLHAFFVAEKAMMNVSFFFFEIEPNDGISVLPFDCFDANWFHSQIQIMNLWFSSEWTKPCARMHSTPYALHKHLACTPFKMETNRSQAQKETHQMSSYMVSFKCLLDFIYCCYFCRKRWIDTHIHIRTHALTLYNNSKCCVQNHRKKCVHRRTHCVCCCRCWPKRENNTHVFRFCFVLMNRWMEERPKKKHGKSVSFIRFWVRERRRPTDFYFWKTCLNFKQIIIRIGF